MKNLEDAFEKEITYKYSTSEISQYYGLTGKGLAFYEEKGLISPGRQNNKKYREYSLRDCYHLYYSKFYRSCGFQLNEIICMLEDESIEDISSNFKEKAKMLEEEAKYKERISWHLNRISSKLDNLPQGVNIFSVKERPEMYRLYVRRLNDRHESSPEESKEFSFWNKNIPINVASLQFPYLDIIAGLTEFNTGIGNIILAEDFEFLKLEKSKRVQYLPPQKCLHTIICFPDIKLNSLEPLMPSLEYMKKNGLKLAGDPVTEMLIVVNTDHGGIRYDEIWFPVEQEG